MAETSLLSPTEVDERWQRLHRRFAERMIASTRVAEPAVGMGRRANVEERLVQAIWSDQLLRSGELATASGKSLEIIEPGRWNTSRGPDFQDARIRIAGELVTGDIEIHVDSADWYNHGHQRDFEYNNVVLHVGLFAHDDRPYDEKQNGARLERLVLEDFLEPDLETIRATLNLGDYPYARPADLGRCHEEFLRLPEDGLVEFLKIAGRSRVEAKIARFTAQRSTANFQQVVYQALLTGQGFKSSKTLYFLLGKRAPIAELADLARDFHEEQRAGFWLSVLLHVASLVPQQSEFAAVEDPETLDYAETLRSYWKPARPYLSDRIIPPTKRWYAGMRPAGFPTRRLAAVAELLGRLMSRETPLLGAIRTLIRKAPYDSMKPAELRKHWKELYALVALEPSGKYFETHFTFGGKKQSPQSLLGEPAAASLLFNVFLPLLVVEAREEGDKVVEAAAWKAITRFPRLEENSVVRFMKRRLFGESGRIDSLFKLEVFQQSMLKVFADCCAQNERTCDDCTFIALGERLRSVK